MIGYLRRHGRRTFLPSTRYYLFRLCRDVLPQGEMRAYEMVISDLKCQVCPELGFVFGKRQCFSLQGRILPTQGQIESFDQAGVYIPLRNTLGIAVDNSSGDRNQAPSFFLFHHLRVAKLGEGLFFCTPRTAPLPRRGIGNGNMVTIQQGNAVAIQSITDKQGHLPTKDIGRTLDQFRSALLGSRTHHHRQDQSVF